MRIERSLLTTFVVAALACSRPSPALDPGPRYPDADVASRWRELVARGPVRLPADTLTPATACPPLATLQREAEALVALKTQRTPKALALIRAEAGDLVPPFLAALGVTRSTAPRTAALLDAALAEVDYFLFAEKLALMCPRPHQVNALVQPVIAVPRHPSYPSGHAGESAMLADVAAVLAPEHAPALAALALGVAARRELAGVHYASDSAEGQRIGHTIARAFIAAPPPELAAAKIELAGRAGPAGDPGSAENPAPNGSPENPAPNGSPENPAPNGSPENPAPNGPSGNPGPAGNIEKHPRKTRATDDR